MRAEIERKKDMMDVICAGNGATVGQSGPRAADWNLMATRVPYACPEYPGKDCGSAMAMCPDCDADLDLDETEVDEGAIVTCPDCGSAFEIVNAQPLELNKLDDEDDDDEDDIDDDTDELDDEDEDSDDEDDDFDDDEDDDDFDDDEDDDYE